MEQCQADLTSHPWKPSERLMLSAPDDAGFYQVWICWTCPRCHQHVWADGVVHQTTPSMSPAQWEALTLDAGPWQAQVERERTRARQQHHVHRLLRASVHPRRTP